MRFPGGPVSFFTRRLSAREIARRAIRQTGNSAFFRLFRTKIFCRKCVAPLAFGFRPIEVASGGFFGPRGGILKSRVPPAAINLESIISLLFARPALITRRMINGACIRDFPPRGIIYGSDVGRGCCSFVSRILCSPRERPGALSPFGGRAPRARRNVRRTGTPRLWKN